MEQIVIKHTDGSETPLFSRKNISGISKAAQTTALLSEDVVKLTVSSAVPLPLGIGDTVSIFGRTYKANQLPGIGKNGLRRFEYDVTFEGLQYDLIDAQFKLPPDAYGDTFYSDLYGHMRVLIWNANRVQPGKWVLGKCPAEGTTEYKNLTTSSRNCLQVLQDICTQWEVEFSLTPGSKTTTINIAEKTGATHPFTLRYGRGKGLYTLKRTNVNNAGITTRLFVYGGQNNLGQNYGHTRLCLPGTDRLTSYVENQTAIKAYGIKENEKLYDIEPGRVGVITAVGADELTFYDTTSGDNAMFDLNAKKEDGSTLYLLGDTAAKVKFQTGQLAGYEFDIHTYDHETRKFVIKRFTDENGMAFPSDTSGAFRFAKGDKYIITDIQLPQSYVAAAERSLLAEAVKDFPDMTQPKVSYKLSISEDFFTALYGDEADTEILHVGDYIKVEDEDIGVNKAVRIVKIERDLLKRHSYDITLSDTVTKNTTVRVLNELEDIREIITINNLADPAKARRRWMATEELLNMVFDPEGDYYTDKIKPLSIETQMLSVGAKSTQFTLQNVTFQPNYNKDPNALLISSGRLIHYAIEENIRTWGMSGATYGNLNPNTAYFIYAICPIASNSGTIVISQDALKVDSTPGVYTFLVGVLNSVVTDAGGKNPGRLVSLTYGSSTINGRFLRTGRIESSGGGSCYFDLDNDEIGGVINFVGGDGNYHNVADLQQQTADLNDYIDATLPGIFGDIYAQIDGKIETFFGTTDPSAEWNTAEDKAKHVGDLWYNTETLETKRYTNLYAWEIVQDKDAIQAMKDAAAAQDTADGKRRVFVSTPTTPYDIGDLWVQGASGDILRANISRKAGSPFYAADWVRASKYTGDENLNAFIDTYNATISDIYSQLDGVIETWFYTGKPTLENLPASEWKTQADMEKHLGDLYYNNDDGSCYRFSKIEIAYDQGTKISYKWVEVADTAIAQALAAAAAAQDTADNKRRVFVSTPYPPYDVGDLWASGTFLKVCKTPKAKGASYAASDWQNATNYTGDENLNAFIDGVFGETISDIYNQIDGKLESFYGTTDPSTDWEENGEEQAHVGDQWYNTETHRLYRWIRYRLHSSWLYKWEEITNQDALDAAAAAAAAQDTADGKRRVFVDTPYPPYDVGDLWTDGSDLYRCINSRQTGKFVATDWGRATNYTNDDAINNFINSVYTPGLEDIEEQIDGKIETWYQNTDPAENWTTTEERKKHVGDMWYNGSSHELKRYYKTEMFQVNPHPYQPTTYGGSQTTATPELWDIGEVNQPVFAWKLIEDQTAIDAYEAASHAQDTADGKRQVFVDTPYGPYDIGDLWLRTWTDADGIARKDLFRCVTARASGFNVNDWAIATFYDNTQVTIDSGIVTAGTVQLANGNSQSIVAGITGGENEKANEAEARKVRIWAGASKENRFTAPFRVLQDGSLYASQATIEGIIRALDGTFNGTIYAKAGTIGGLGISGNDLIGLDENGQERIRIGIGSLPTIGTAFKVESLPYSLTSTYNTVEGPYNEQGFYVGKVTRYNCEISTGRDTGAYTDNANLSASVFFTISSNVRTVTFGRFDAGYTTTNCSPGFTPTARGTATLYRVNGTSKTKIKTWNLSQSTPDETVSGLSAGNYQVDVSIYVQFGGEYWYGSTEFIIGGGILIETTNTAPNTTIIAKDGFMTMQGSADKYMFFSASEGFETRFNNFGLKVSGSGIQKLVNGSWVTL